MGKATKSARCVNASTQEESRCAACPVSMFSIKNASILGQSMPVHLRHSHTTTHKRARSLHNYIGICDAISSWVCTLPSAVVPSWLEVIASREAN